VPAPGLDQAKPTEMQIIGDTALPIPAIATDPLAVPEAQDDGFLTVFMSETEAQIKAANQTIDVVANMIPRIAGGHPAEDNEFPFAASIAIYGVHACGGTLIAPRVVMTAAHCVYDKESNDFYPLGDMTLRIGNVDRSKGDSHWPKGLIIPNTFQPTQGFYGDVALILIDSPVSGRASKLVTKQKQASMYKALGWGKTEEGFISYTLNQVELRGVAEATCKGLLEKYQMGGLPKDHFCAGLNSSGADTCEGDSGGPLLSGDYQAGITSYGPPESECGKGVNFGVYTSVAYWNNWVQDSLSVYNLRGKKKPWKFNKPQFNVCYEGGTYKNTTAESMGQCLEQCRASKGCAAWTWSKGSKACVFKHKGTFQAQKSEKCQSGRFY
jgi:secreted trypsin-like serine protease